MTWPVRMLHDQPFAMQVWDQGPQGLLMRVHKLNEGAGFRCDQNLPNCAVPCNFVAQFTVEVVTPDEWARHGQNAEGEFYRRCKRHAAQMLGTFLLDRITSA